MPQQSTWFTTGLSLAICMTVTSCSRTSSQAPPAMLADAQVKVASDSEPSESERHKKLHDFVVSFQKQSFSEFRRNENIQDVRTTLLADKKLTTQAVDQISTSLEDYYAALPVTATIQVPVDGTDSVVSFDCVPIRRQPALSRVSHATQAQLEAPPVDPDDGAPDRPSVVQPSVPVGAGSTPSVNPKAYVVNSLAPSCPPGTVPIRRTTLPEAVMQPGTKGASLSDERGFRGKGPLAPVLDRNAMRSTLALHTVVVPESAYKHRYAHARVQAAAIGIASRLSVWSPKVLDDDMSLSQVWIVGGNPNDSSLQTVEAGWQVYNYWDTNEPALFVYQTSDNYGSTGCYVTRCSSLQPARPESFRITSSKVVIGRPITPKSVVGGTQAVISIKWIRNGTTGSWWLKVNDDWIGYYPSSVYSGGALSKQASYVDFGGEATGLEPTSQMGSGHYAEEGKKYASFQSQLRYLSTASKFVDAAVVPSAPDSPCYTIVVGSGMPPEGSAGVYFYFGGPGSHHFPQPPAPPVHEACTPPPGRGLTQGGSPPQGENPPQGVGP